MIDSEIEMATNGGVMNAFVTRPDEGGPFPVIFFYMDAPGKREELHDMARRFAATGYFVMLPNLYYRERASFEVDPSSGESRKEMLGLMGSLSNRIVIEDTRVMIEFVEAEEAADASRIGCVGYCMSGPFSLSVAAAFPDRVKAAASIYGIRLAVDEEDSPHLGFSKTPAELYIAAAETDSYAPPKMIVRVEEALSRRKAKGRVEWYPGTHHGFAFPGRGAIYNKTAAERHWSRLHSLFDRNLKD